MMVLSITHALSDGPGIFNVANTFLQNLAAATRDNKEESTATPIQSQPLIDIQSKLLGDDYGTQLHRNDDVYRDLKRYQEALDYCNSNDTTNQHPLQILPPEALQKIPSDDEVATAAGTIDAMYIQLNHGETSSLLKVCKSVGATIQGIVSTAALVARYKLISKINATKTSLSEKIGSSSSSLVQCAIQVPINTRVYVDSDDKSIDYPTTCLCGSAGIIHSIDLDTTRIENDPKYLLEVAKTCSRKMLEAKETKQPIEWLHRLMNDPTTIPPYSLMASSIGISPVQPQYGGGTINVSECLFFGGSLQTSSKAQGTMIHVLTFRDKLQIMMNYTSPGIQAKFMTDLSSELKSLLLSIIEDYKQ
jgi:hypothetical protein